MGHSTFSPRTFQDRQRWRDRRGRLRDLLAAGALAASVAVAGCSQEASSRPAPSGSGKKAHLVELATVSIDTLRLTSVYTGTLRSRRVLRVFNREEGQVVELPFFEGDRIAAGDIVLRLDGALIEAELAKARAVMQEKNANAKRVERLRRSKMVSEDEVLRATTEARVARAEESLLRTRLGYTEVRAPFAGVVSARLVDVGDIVPRHSHVLTITDPSTLLTELSVSELLLPHLVVDAPVSVRIDALGDRPYRGRILRIHPELDSRTRQGLVEVELDPVPRGAQAGQFARITFSLDALDRKVVPFSALRRDRTSEFVYRLGAGDVVERVAVRSGRRQAYRVELLEGLAAGDRVVIKGFLGLGPGMKVKPVNPTAPAAGGPSGPATGG